MRRRGPQRHFTGCCMDLRCADVLLLAARRVEMRDETRLLFVDEFSLSFHIHFYRLFKWLVAAPFGACALALLAAAFAGDDGRAALPA